MALVNTCPRCKCTAVLDTTCGYCYVCMAKYDDLEHKPDCRETIGNRIELNKRLAVIHNMIDQQQKIANEAVGQLSALRATLREITPCPECKALALKRLCDVCGNTGYRSRPTEEELSEELPPAPFA